MCSQLTADNAKRPTVRQQLCLRLHYDANLLQRSFVTLVNYASSWSTAQGVSLVTSLFSVPPVTPGERPILWTHWYRSCPALTISLTPWSCSLRSSVVLSSTTIQRQQQQRKGDSCNSLSNDCDSAFSISPFDSIDLRSIRSIRTSPSMHWV